MDRPDLSVPILGRGPTPAQLRRVRREAEQLAPRVRKQIAKHGYRLPQEIRDGIVAAVAELEAALAAGSHDAICAAMVRVDELADRHLGFAKKSVIREYADSIGVAVLVALFLRAFVVEAFKIPSGSMIPTLAVGDHIFVNKFIYGLRIPFTKIKLFEWRKPHRGEVIVFMYPKDPDKDYIKRVVAVEGETVQVKNSVLYVDGKAVEHTRVPGIGTYWDFEEDTERWRQNSAIRVEEKVDGHDYITLHEENMETFRDFPKGREDCLAQNMEFKNDGCLVPKDTVFVCGDNRDHSNDSRFWGTVPLENIKGRALVVWWSQGGHDEGIRWGRMGHVIE